MISEALRARRIFSEIASLDEKVFPLDRAALAIGLEEYPDLEVERYLRQLDTLAARAQVLAESRTPRALIESINDVLFVQEGLHGNSENYYDPRNSFLNEVLDRKAGIPISLSVVYIEVARRIDLTISGIGFPGHFIVKYADPENEILIDPFEKGRILTLKDCQELLDRVYASSAVLQPTMLDPMEKKGIITRMLYNLKGIYSETEDCNRALSVIERVLMLNPGLPSEIRDRGLLYMQTSLFAKALADLETYLKHTSAPEDQANIESHVRALRKIIGTTN